MDVYVAQLQPSGPFASGLHFGGNSYDYPSAVAIHPAGGIVVGGVTWSTNLPCSVGALQPAFAGGPGDGFLCWLDPMQCAAPIRYCSYFGGNAGQDMITGLAIESSGVVTVTGFSSGGTFRTTPRCLQPTFAAGQGNGIVGRVALAGNGAADLEYSTYVGTGSALLSVVLDDLGDAWVGGANWMGTHPVVNAFLPWPPGSRAGVLMHVPLLAGGVERQELACATPACGAPLYTSAGSAPVPGEAFLLRATNAPPNGAGLLLLGLPQQCAPLLNVNLLVTPPPTVFTYATQLGGAAVPLAIPGGLAPVPSWGFGAQWMFLTNTACPGSGLLAASERLLF